MTRETGSAPKYSRSTLRRMGSDHNTRQLKTSKSRVKLRVSTPDLGWMPNFRPTSIHFIDAHDLHPKSIPWCKRMGVPNELAYLPNVEGMWAPLRRPELCDDHLMTAHHSAQFAQPPGHIRNVPDRKDRVFRSWVHPGSPAVGVSTDRRFSPLIGKRFLRRWHSYSAPWGEFAECVTPRSTQNCKRVVVLAVLHHQEPSDRKFFAKVNLGGSDDSQKVPILFDRVGSSAYTSRLDIYKVGWSFAQRLYLQLEETTLLNTAGSRLIVCSWK